MKFLFCILIINSICLSQTANSKIGHDSINTKLLNELVINQINKERLNYGISKLEKSNTLYIKTKLHNDWLIKTGRFEHSKSTLGENIERISCLDTITYHTLSKIIVLSWMNSHGHKYNILNSVFKSISISCGVLTKDQTLKKYLYPNEVIKKTLYTLIITSSFGIDLN